MAGAATGGILGGALMASNPSDLSRMKTFAPNTAAVAGMTTAGGIGGAVAGAKIAGKAGGGARSKVLSGIAGAAIGSVGGASMSMAGVADHVRRNRNLFASSAYGNQSSATAAALNASGNIVLGMHNSRNGY